MKRQEAVLRRLLLGDDGSASRAKAALAKQQQEMEDDDQALLYLARELEEAIVQSLLEATKTEQEHKDPHPSNSHTIAANGKTATGRSISRNHLPTRQQQQQTGGGSGGSGGGDDDSALMDPAVQAFMEKRRLRQQAQREESLARSMEEEAQRLVSTLSNGEQEEVGIIIPSKQVIPTVPKASPEAFDPTHILHPDNSTALKAAMALLQLARRTTKGMVETEFATRDSASLQMANIWLTQAAHYLKKQRAAVRAAENVAGHYGSGSGGGGGGDNGCISPLGMPAPQLQQLPNSSSPLDYSPGGGAVVSGGGSGGGPFHMESSMESNQQQQQYYVPPHSETQPTLLQRSRSNSIRGSEMMMLQQRMGSSNSAHTTPRHGGGYRAAAIEQPQEQPQGEWSCPVCTLVNKATYLTCEACGLPLPST
eukprot:gene4109-4503_t